MNGDEGFIYRVVMRRSPDSEWESAHTTTKFYTKPGPARGARTQRIREHEFHARQCARNGRTPPSIPEYAIQRAPIGEWVIV